MFNETGLEIHTADDGKRKKYSKENKVREINLAQRKTDKYGAFV